MLEREPHRRFDLPGARHPWGDARKPFSDAVMAGGMLYVSGRVGFDPQTGRLPADPAEQARNVLDWLVALLAQAGLTMQNLVVVTIYAADVAHFDAFNEVYLRYFDGPLPARAFVGSGALLFGAHFQLTAVAASSA
jgi:2-iminobutanoate/2-iminopropanoate deaminase